jgi:hypothetical protein
MLVQSLAFGATYQVVSKYSGQCLDVNEAGLDDGIRLQQWTCGPQPNQRWQFQPLGDAYLLVAEHSQKCLDLDVTTQYDGFHEGDLVQQWGCHGPPFNDALWKTVTVGEYFQIVSVHSGKCLAVRTVYGPQSAHAVGNRITQMNCSLGDSVLWKLVPAN